MLRSSWPYPHNPVGRAVWARPLRAVKNARGKKPVSNSFIDCGGFLMRGAVGWIKELLERAGEFSK